MSFSYLYASPMGELLLEADQKAIVRVEFLFDRNGTKEVDDERKGKMVEDCTDCKPLQLCVQWLDAYFEQDREKELPPLPPVRFTRPSLFFEKVWRIMMATKVGETITYGELAARAGKPRAARAVGQAVRSHHLPILVPCHRVLYAGAGGRKRGIGNYSGGHGPETKKWLLEHEEIRGNGC